MDVFVAVYSTYTKLYQFFLRVSSSIRNTSQEMMSWSRPKSKNPAHTRIHKLTESF